MRGGELGEERANSGRRGIRAYKQRDVRSVELGKSKNDSGERDTVPNERCGLSEKKGQVASQSRAIRPKPLVSTKVISKQEMRTCGVFEIEGRAYIVVVESVITIGEERDQVHTVPHHCTQSKPALTERASEGHSTHPLASALIDERD